MATRFSQKHQKRTLFVTIFLCLALLAATLYVTVNSYVNSSSLFVDQELARAISERLEISPRSLTAKMMSEYEYMKIGLQFANDEQNGYFPYVVCTLGNAAYTERFLEQIVESETAEPHSHDDEEEESKTEAEESAEAEEEQKFYDENSISFIYYIAEPEDLKLFSSMKYISLVSSYDISSIQYYCNMYAYYNQMYGVGETEFDSTSIINGLSMTALKNLEAFSGMADLEYLMIANSGISNLRGVEELTKLKTLDISYSRVTDISALKSISLENLYIGSSDLKDYSTVSDLNTLKVLDLVNLGLEDLSFIKGMTNLEKLGVDSNKLTNLDDVSELTNLDLLTASYNELNNISGIAKLTKLTSITLNNNKIDNVSAFYNLVNLNEVNISANRILSLSGFEKLEHLEVLDASNNVWSEDIDDESNETSTEDSSKTESEKFKITSVEPLKNCVEMKTLTLNENFITDLSFLSGMTKLETLSANSNKITVIDDLNKCASLKTIELKDNEIVDVSALNPLKKLETIDLTNNKIIDIAVLENAFDPEVITTITLSGNEKTITFANWEIIEKAYEKATVTGKPSSDPALDESDVSDESDSSDESSETSVIE